MNPDDRCGSPSELLQPLRDAGPGAGGGVDVGRAVRAGRRRVRTRRAAAVAASVAATLAIVVPSALWPRTEPPVTPAAPVTADPRAFEVSTPAFVVGSAGGFTPDTYETGRYQQVITLRSADPARRDTAVITMYAPGRLQPGGDPLPPVNGRRARSTSGGVAWEWAPGAWGTVTLREPDRDKAHRVAQSVLARPGRPVTVPFTVDQRAIGPGRGLVGVVTSYADTGVAVKYAAGDLTGDRVEVGLRPSRPSTPPNAELDGTPAVITPSEVVLLPEGERYAVYARGGDEATRRALVTAVTPR
ncbi:hypothetical protein AB0I81_45035 [Nonomuraea sp. NPDC050404]|uniref:hypothetical protein n=1 Tax=Nonomuraea sp. NPDC050404 TaxID=3155783 RepID=UPI0033E90432